MKAGNHCVKCGYEHLNNMPVTYCTGFRWWKPWTWACPIGEHLHRHCINCEAEYVQPIPPGVVVATAGAEIDAGQFVYLGDDGKVYPAKGGGRC